MEGHAPPAGHPHAVRRRSHRGDVATGGRVGDPPPGAALERALHQAVHRCRQQLAVVDLEAVEVDPATAERRAPRALEPVDTAVVGAHVDIAADHADRRDPVVLKVAGHHGEAPEGAAAALAVVDAPRGSDPQAAIAVLGGGPHTADPEPLLAAQGLDPGAAHDHGGSARAGQHPAGAQDLDRVDVRRREAVVTPEAADPAVPTDHEEAPSRADPDTLPVDGQRVDPLVDGRPRSPDAAAHGGQAVVESADPQLVAADRERRHVVVGRAGERNAAPGPGAGPGPQAVDGAQAGRTTAPGDGVHEADGARAGSTAEAVAEGAHDVVAQRSGVVGRQLDDGSARLQSDEAAERAHAEVVCPGVEGMDQTVGQRDVPGDQAAALEAA